MKSTVTRIQYIKVLPRGGAAKVRCRTRWRHRPAVNGGAGRATTLRSPRRRSGDLAFLYGYKKPAGQTNCCAQAYLALQLQESCFATPFEHGPRLRGSVLQNAHGTPTVGIRHQRVALVLALEVLLGVHVHKPLDEHQSRVRTSKRIWPF